MTFPRILHSDPSIGSYAGFSGMSQTPFLSDSLLTVASSFMRATTISPLRADCWIRTITVSPSSMPAPIMLSPRTFNAKSLSSVLPSKGTKPLISSCASIGLPAVTVPITGTALKLGAAGARVFPLDADFDGTLDPCYFNPSTGKWTWKSLVNGGGATVKFGDSTVTPHPFDWDGDGMPDTMGFYSPYRAGFLDLFREADGTQAAHMINF